MDVEEFLRESAPATEQADGWVRGGEGVDGGGSRGPVIPTS